MVVMSKELEKVNALVLPKFGNSSKEDELVESLILENLRGMYHFDYEVDGDIREWVSENISDETESHFYTFDSPTELANLGIPYSVTMVRTLYNSDLCDYYSSQGVSVVNVSPYNDCVDIIMPMYNNEKTMRLSIESVLSQTHTNFRLIMVDDGSFDGTPEIAKSYLSDPRVVYLPRLHRGISSGLNFGIANSSSELLARQDADDLWMPWHLDLLLTTFKLHSNLDLLGSKVFINLDERPKNPRSVSVTYNSGEKLWLDLAYNNVFNHSTMLFKRSAYESAGGYDSAHDGYEDWHLWSKMVSKTNAMVIDLATVYYHVGNRNEKQMIFLSRLAKSRGLRLEDIL